jgi:hypothetical protein
MEIQSIVDSLINVNNIQAEEIQGELNQQDSDDCA